MYSNEIHKTCLKYDDLNNLDIEAVIRKVDKFYNQQLVINLSNQHNSSFVAPQDLKFDFKTKSNFIPKYKAWDLAIIQLNKEGIFEKKPFLYQKFLDRKLINLRTKNAIKWFKSNSKPHIQNKVNFWDQGIKDQNFYNTIPYLHDARQFYSRNYNHLRNNIYGIKYLKRSTFNTNNITHVILNEFHNNIVFASGDNITSLNKNHFYPRNRKNYLNFLREEIVIFGRPVKYAKFDTYQTNSSIFNEKRKSQYRGKNTKKSFKRSSSWKNR